MNNHDNHNESCCSPKEAANYGHGMGHGSAEGFLRRFWVVTFLLIPLVLTNEVVVGFLGLPTFSIGKWVQFVIATIVFGFALVFFQHAWHEIKARSYGMMTLVSIAVGAGYLFSVVSTFFPSLEVEFYLEISTLIWVLLFGHYLEARSGAAAGNALQEVAKLLPKNAHKLVDGKEQDIAVADLVKGDTVLVKPGEKIPADGNVILGSANVNESLVSGESKPVNKLPDAKVVAGSICLDGSLSIVLTRVGEHSTIGQIQKLIVKAQRTKPRSQQIADKASAILTAVAGLTAILTILIWSLVIGQPFVFSLTLAITVLVIACPHALGLAIPTVTTITTSLAVKNGVFIKNLAKIEVIRKTDYVVLDKTGTLTEGYFGVTDVIPFGDVSKEQLVQTAASLDKHSAHIIGQSIVSYANTQGVEFKDISNFKSIAGKGIKAVLGGTLYSAGNRALMEENNVPTDSSKQLAEQLSARGKTVTYIANNKEVIGLIALSDKVKKESKKAIQDLHELGVKVAMLTGDNKDVAKGVSTELGIDTYFAEVLPEEKYKHIKELQEKGNIVLMVGDGINDAPALAQADAGVAVGAGTDVAVEAGDVVLTRNNPQDIVRLLILAKKVYRKMIQNLVWALGYNIIAIPAAAGVFAAWGFFLRPEIGALVMSLSTIIIVVNALTLKKVKL